MYQARRLNKAAACLAQATLDAVWRLCRDTVLVGALDSNTDSNTRQRDLCQLDAMLASRYQGAVAGLAAEHLRWQVRNGCFNEAPCSPLPSVCQCFGPTTARHQQTASGRGGRSPPPSPRRRPSPTTTRWSSTSPPVSSSLGLP